MTEKKSSERRPTPKRDPRAKFVSLCEKRVEKTIKSMRLVGNLSNRSHYKYQEAEVKKVLAALRREVDSLERKFLESGSTEVKFRL